MMNDNDKFDKWLREKAENVPVPNPDDFWPGTQKAMSQNIAWKNLVGGLGIVFFLAGLTLVFWPKTELKSNANDVQIVNENQVVPQNEKTRSIENHQHNEQHNSLLDAESALVNNRSSNSEKEPTFEEVSESIIDQSNGSLHLNAEIEVNPSSSIVPTKIESQIEENTFNPNNPLVVNENSNPFSIQYNDERNTLLTADIIEEYSPDGKLQLEPIQSNALVLEDEKVESERASLNEEYPPSLSDVPSAAEETEEDKENFIPELTKLAAKPKVGVFTQVQVGYFSDFRPTYGFELGMSYDFNENWGLQGGLGIQMVDRVGFSTSLSRVDYSFDRFDEAYKMDMHNLLYASLPLSTYYRYNRHSFHTGVVLHRAIQARASIVHPDGKETSSWGNPNPANLWHTSVLFEYRYAMRENWQLGLRYHWNNRTMIMGVNDFNAIHIQLIKWW